MPASAAPTDITGSSAAGTAAGASGAAFARREIVLNAVTGKQLRTYDAAASGGAVSAGLRHTVIVGDTAVTSYLNATGRAVWRDPTGAAGQAWRVDGRKLYVTVSAGGQVGTDPVTAVRQIDLRTGAERLIRPPRRLVRRRAERGRRRLAGVLGEHRFVDVQHRERAADRPGTRRRRRGQ